MKQTNEELNDEKSLNEIRGEQDENISSDPVQSNSATTPEIPGFGWTAYAERINGRFAMIGLSAVLLVELLTNKAFLDWAGIIN